MLVAYGEGGCSCALGLFTIWIDLFVIDLQMFGIIRYEPAYVGTYNRDTTYYLCTYSNELSIECHSESEHEIDGLYFGHASYYGGRATGGREAQRTDFICFWTAPEGHSGPPPQK